jgi:DNA-binding transcriptional ArsR family regulator
MKKHQITKTFLIQDLETLKVIADPLRSQILELLIHEALNVRQVAEKLGLSPSKLYYHVNLLEKHGLVEVVDTRVVANMIEKIYRATAPDVDIDPALLSFMTDSGKENINSLIAGIIDSTRADFLRSLEARAFDLERGAQ